MFYIHQSNCISPQRTFSDIQLNEIIEPVHNKLFAVEAANPDVPLNLLRRMGKAVKMGITTGLPLVKQHPVDGIIIGTANGGMEDCIKFLNQVIDYDEGRLTPTNFVQSTTNAIAAQIGMMSTNQGYNITHVHRGFSFENALIDADMLLKEHPDRSYLLGGIDEISEYNYNIENLAGWYKKEEVSSKSLYDTNTSGSIPGEGAAMFIVNSKREGAFAQLKAYKTFHTNDKNVLADQLKVFLKEHQMPDVLLSGENGNVEMLPFYETAEHILKTTSVARYKHLFGDFATASALSLWLTIQGLQSNVFPAHMYKTDAPQSIGSILMYHAHRDHQHSFMLISKP